jgi:hypothetical protein
MLELGRPGAAAAGTGVLSVLHDGAAGAFLRASNWRKSATAVVGERRWTFAKHEGELISRWADDPEDAVRLRARSSSFWPGTWSLDLEGTAIEMRSASLWRGTHRYLAGGQQVAVSGSTGGWSPRPTLTAEAPLPPAHQAGGS